MKSIDPSFHFKSTGHIYVLTNPLLPADCVKIGFTRKSPKHRASVLSKMAAIPTPFVLFCAHEVRDVVQAERRLHLVLDDKRISSSKEFFRISPEDAQSLAVEIAAFEEESEKLAENIHLSHTLLGARYLPHSSLRNRKVLYGMIAATVNNTLFERITGERRTVVDGFLSIGQVADYLRIQRRSAAKALSDFSEIGKAIACHPVEDHSVLPVFDMIRYRHGHATWRFSDAYRQHFYDPGV